MTMPSIKSLIVASICLLAFSTPAWSADLWSGTSHLGRAVAGVEADLKTARFRAAAELSGKNVGIEIVEVPLAAAKLEAATFLPPLVQTIDRAVEAAKAAAVARPEVKSALRSRGLSPNDVIAVGKTESGSLKILIQAT